MVSSQGARWRPGPAFSCSGLPCVVVTPSRYGTATLMATPSRFGDTGIALRSTLPGSVPRHAGRLSSDRSLVGPFQTLQSTLGAETLLP
jgi:hypothetical protein